MLTLDKQTTPSHDELYLKFLQKSFGTTSVPFYGALIATVGLVFIALIFLMYSTVIFISDKSTKTKIHHQQVFLKNPVVI